MARDGVCADSNKGQNTDWWVVFLVALLAAGVVAGIVLGVVCGLRRKRKAAKKVALPRLGVSRGSSEASSRNSTRNVLKELRVAGSATDVGKGVTQVEEKQRSRDMLGIEGVKLSESPKPSLKQETPPKDTPLVGEGGLGESANTTGKAETRKSKPDDSDALL